MAIIKIKNAAIDLDAAEIPNLSANKITSDTLADARVPDLNTSKITAGTLSDARLPANALNSNIDLTNLSASNLTSGTVATARLGSGTADATTFLRGDNSFAEPSGGSWTLVSTTTASDDAYVDITFSGSYSIYKITFVNMIGGTDNTNLNHQILIGGSVQTGSSYAYGNLFVDSNGGNGYNASGDATSVKMTYAPMGSATNDNTSGEILIFNPSSSVRKHTAYRFTGDQKVGTYLNANVGGSRWDSSDAWSGFRVLYSSGNIASGVMKLWGQA